MLTPDIPLLTPEAINDFCALRGTGGRFHYPPSGGHQRNPLPGRETDVCCAEKRRFTGGNIFLLDRRLFPAVCVKPNSLSKCGKPLQLARLLGLGFILKFVTRTLTVAEAEKGCRSFLN